MDHAETSRDSRLTSSVLTHCDGLHSLGVEAIDRPTLVTRHDKPHLRVPLGNALGVAHKSARSPSTGGLSRSSKQITVMSKHYGTVRAEVCRCLWLIPPNLDRIMSYSFFSLGLYTLFPSRIVFVRWQKQWKIQYLGSRRLFAEKKAPARNAPGWST